MLISRKLVMMFVLGFVLVSCKTEKEPEIKTVAVEESKSLDPNATYAKAEFTIEGMSCAVGCAKKIEKNLAGMPGVKAAEVDFDRKLAMVEFDEAKVTTSDLEETVTKTADVYKVTEMKTVNENSAKKECKPDCEKDCCKNMTEAEKKACKEKCAKKCCASKA